MLYSWHNHARIPRDGWYYKKSMEDFMIVSVLLIVIQPLAYTPDESKYSSDFINATSKWSVTIGFNYYSLQFTFLKSGK
jgi:hypothetical protein